LTDAIFKKGLWCKQVVYIVKTPVGRDIARDNTVLSGVISTSAAGIMGWGPPKNAHSRKKQVIGDGLRFHSDEAQATEVAIAAAVLNRMLDRPNSVRAA
jgi:hypothetical protein